MLIKSLNPLLIILKLLFYFHFIYKSISDPDNNYHMEPQALMN